MNCLVNYKKWMDSCLLDEKSKAELSLMEKEEIADSFYRDLEFGTGGLRGIMGVGTNRMNIFTVRRATQGLANEILKKGEEYVEQGVVIAYDSRNCSYEFAMECVKVLSANGIKVFLFNELRPTPELSFAVRHLGCFRGIVITASHNPKDYNGYKVYGEDGAQIPPFVANDIQKYINETDIFSDVKVDDAPKYTLIGEEIDNAYIKAVKAQTMGMHIPENMKVVYTPLHGTGNKLVRRILKEIGTENVFVVPEQEFPNGDFPTVQSPNPENKEAFNIAIKYAKEKEADLVLGTDPDSDRIGVVVRNSNGEYVVLTGNQTGALLCEFILRKLSETKKLDENDVVIKTIVTTEMIGAIAKEYGVGLCNVLTGFKFIGEKINTFEQKEKEKRFVFGLEESYGYLKGTYCRDKDAIVAAMLVCEMTADYKTMGLTLYDGLIKLYNKYGYYIDELESITLNGVEGTEKINNIMDNLRKKELSEIAGISVLEKKDYLQSIDGLPKSNVLKIVLKNAWFAVRPSGTEPKIKFYFGCCDEESKTCREKIEELKKVVLDVFKEHVK